MGEDCRRGFGGDFLYALRLWHIILSSSGLTVFFSPFFVLLCEYLGRSESWTWLLGMFSAVLSALGVYLCRSCAQTLSCIFPFSFFFSFLGWSMTSVIPLNTDRRRENENRRSSARLDCGGGARLGSGGDVQERKEHFGWSWKKKPTEKWRGHRR